MKQPTTASTPAEVLFQYLLSTKKFTSKDYIIYTKKEERSTIIQLKNIEGIQKNYPGNSYLDN